jgi:hypothetical protein
MTVTYVFDQTFTDKMELFGKNDKIEFSAADKGVESDRAEWEKKETRRLEYNKLVNSTLPGMDWTQGITKHNCAVYRDANYTDQPGRALRLARSVFVPGLQCHFVQWPVHTTCYKSGKFPSGMTLVDPAFQCYLELSTMTTAVVGKWPRQANILQDTAPEVFSLNGSKWPKPLDVEIDSYEYNRYVYGDGGAYTSTSVDEALASPGVEQAKVLLSHEVQKMHAVRLGLDPSSVYTPFADEESEEDPPPPQSNPSEVHSGQPVG